MYYTVYKITNTLNGKIYIGVHKTLDLEDNYMGSGVSLKKDISKLGRNSFKKEYLFFATSEEEMYEMESLVVNNDFILNEDTYNIALGGGGWSKVDIEYRREICSKAGSWDNIEKRKEIYKKGLVKVPIGKRKEIAKKMGLEFGGKNKLTKEEIEIRLEKIKNVNLMEYGWVNKVSELLGLTHSQVKRFIKKHYGEEVYQRNSRFA